VVETWRGLYPITAFVHDALTRKSTRDSAAALSEAEQTLLTVCDFWFAFNTGALRGRLARRESLIPLLRAQHAYAEIGAVRVASVLRVLAERLARAPAPAVLDGVVAETEEALARVEDPVEELIARFATERLNLTELSSQRDPF
jgi:hypothetical protein